MALKLFDFMLTHIFWVATIIKADITENPVNISFFSTVGIMMEAKGFFDLDYRDVVGRATQDAKAEIHQSGRFRCKLCVHSASLQHVCFVPITGRLLPIIPNKRASNCFVNNIVYLLDDCFQFQNNHGTFLRYIANKRAILVNYIRKISDHTSGRFSTS
jgi:hypothetical protein